MLLTAVAAGTGVQVYSELKAATGVSHTGAIILGLINMATAVLLLIKKLEMKFAEKTRKAYKHE